MNNSQNAAVVSARPIRLRPPRNRIERRAIAGWTINALIWGMCVCAGLVFTYWKVTAIRAWLGPVIVIIAVVYAVNVAVMPAWRYLVHRWEVTDQAVYSLHGWITKEWRITPISRIQSIDTKQGPLQQWLGLATLKVTTASREGTITVDGLDAAVAEEAARRLTEITQATPGDAT